MKKLFIILVSLTFSSISFGQFTVITPKVGLTISRLRDFPDTYFKPGFAFGVSAEYLFTPKFSLLPLIGLEQKGFLEKGVFVEMSGATSDYKRYISLNYMNLPVMLKYNPFQSNGIYFIAGGFGGYLIAVTERLQATIEDSNYDEKTKKEASDYYRWNSGLSAGGGYDIPIKGKGRINVEIKYEFDVHLEKDIFPTTHTFILSLGYSIGILK
jgi:hypothetical protein